MIKFFRKRRQKLLTESKFSKYLLYAIGEVFLVVIGILIALQVNEWNNERTRKLNEASIIEQLKADLKKSQSELDEVIKNKKQKAKASAIVCHAFWKKDIPHDSIYQYMNIPTGYITYSPTLGTARSLINSGKISLIKSDEIKNQITAYVEKVDYLLKDINRYEETYYRNARALLNEIVPRTLRPSSYFDKLIEESSSSTYDTTRNDEYSDRPSHIEKVPFKVDKEVLFQDKNVYIAYYNLMMDHRNGGSLYNEILESTDALLSKLEGIVKN